MIERSMDRFDLYPARLLGDSAYGSAELLGWLVYEHGIEPHVTVFDKLCDHRQRYCGAVVPVTRLALVAFGVFSGTGHAPR
jgi:hypothetical protein